MSKNPFLNHTFDKTYQQLSLDESLSNNTLYNKVKNNQQLFKTTPTKDVQEANKIAKDTDAEAPKLKFITISKLQNMLRKTYKNTPELQNICLTGGITKINKYKWFWYVDIDDPKRKSLSMSLDVPARVFKKLPFKLKVGDSIDAIGNLSLSKRSQNGLYTKQLMPAGLSHDYLKLIRTKKFLAENGYFNPAHKKSIPKFPHRIAVVTSKQGAVIRDIIEQTRIRDTSIQIVLFPTSLDKPKMIAQQVKNADNKHFDTIIVGRGGGSKKDLQPFNDKNLAITVFNCHTPIISSVGHGIDKSLIDYVADDSVVTPTAAAVDASPNIPKVLQDIQSISNSITAITKDIITSCINQINDILTQPTFQNPAHQFLLSRYNQIQLLQSNIRQQVSNHINNSLQQIQRLYNQLQQYTPIQQLDKVQLKVQMLNNQLSKRTSNILQYKQQRVLIQQEQLHLNTPINKINADNEILKPLILNLNYYANQNIQNKINDVQNVITQLQQVSPYHLMQHGYTYTTHKRHVLTNVNQVHKGNRIHVHTIGGVINATVSSINVRKENK